MMLMPARPIVFVLTREGYDVTTTENSTDALALVKLERFDLLLVASGCPDYQDRI